MEWVPIDAIKFEDELTGQKQDGVQRQIFLVNYVPILHARYLEGHWLSIVDATSHPVKIALHKLILNQIFVKPGLNGLKSAKLMLAIVLEPKNNSTLIIIIIINNNNNSNSNNNNNNNNNKNNTWYGNQFPVNRNTSLDCANDIKTYKWSDFTVKP